VNDPIRVAVLGTGRIGSLHAELVARQVAGLTLAAVHDANRDAVEAVASELGVPVAPSVDELLGSSDVDAVAICTSTDTHVDLIVAAAKAGKAIFCEKPVALTLADVDRALAAVEDAGVLFQIGFNRRFDPAHRAVRDAVASGTIGELHVLRITSRDPEPPPLAYLRSSGGIFLDMTIHDFDMARFVSGSEVEEVYARGAAQILPAISDTGDLDTAVVTLAHENGTLTVIDNSRQAVYGYDQRVEAFGSAGVAVSDNPLEHAMVVRTAEGGMSARLPHFFLERYVPSYLGEWQAFGDAVRFGGPSPVGGSDARAPLAIGLAAWRSVRERRPVQVAEMG
jgi:myo-inositol 2-dehydrogenase / D-chiro-inositol 1-dehydrogenase